MRKSSWALVIWTIAVALWLYTEGRGDCATAIRATCDSLVGFHGMVALLVWAVGACPLLWIWVLTKPRR